MKHKYKFFSRFLIVLVFFITATCDPKSSNNDTITLFLLLNNLNSPSTCTISVINNSTYTITAVLGVLRTSCYDPLPTEYGSANLLQTGETIVQGQRKDIDFNARGVAMRVLSNNFYKDMAFCNTGSGHYDFTWEIDNSNWSRL